VDPVAEPDDPSEDARHIVSTPGIGQSIDDVHSYFGYEPGIHPPGKEHHGLIHVSNHPRAIF
jgi:hypothetical protein